MVATVETRQDVLDARLFGAERSSLGRTGEGRRQEFTTGRACARQALQTLGIAPMPIPAGERGEPLWPRGVTGSITHCRGYRACAIAREEDVIALGIDAHLNAPLPRGLLGRIAVGREREHAVPGWSGPGPGGCRPPWPDKLLFCAKEAVYKACFALAKGPLSLRDIEVSTSGVQRGHLRARLRGPSAFVGGEELGELRGRWGVEDGLVGVAVLVPR
jgi:4'-phosphopantetheinyl transferase EntD